MAEVEGDDRERRVIVIYVLFFRFENPIPCTIQFYSNDIYVKDTGE